MCGFILAGIQAVVLIEVVEMVTRRTLRAKCLSRRTFRVNHVVGEQFDVQVINDIRTFGRTLGNA